MIKSLFWNIRGVRKKISINRLKILKQQHDLKLICICEPHVDFSEIDEFKLKIGLKQVFYNSANRIWVFIDDSIEARIYSQTEQSLSMVLAHNAAPSSLLVTFVHAFCTKTARNLLWTDLSNICNVNLPGVIYGDFNTIISMDEKKGGKPFQISDSLDFIDFISNNSLLDVGFSGAPYTWCNNRSSKARIWKRLDRVLINQQWLNLGISSSITHLARVGSDHAPL